MYIYIMEVCTYIGMLLHCYVWMCSMYCTLPVMFLDPGMRPFVEPLEEVVAIKVLTNKHWFLSVMSV